MRRPCLAAAALLIGAVAVTPAQAALSQRYEPEAASGHLTVQGTSTMHDWEMATDVIRGHLVLSEDDLASLWEKRASSAPKIAPAVYVEIPVRSFRSGKSGLDKKMQQTLKAQIHPVIAYRLETAEIKRGGNSGRMDLEAPLTIDTKGILTVAGSRKMVEILMRIRRLPNNRLEVSGETTLRMTDFGIDPPKLMMGVLRTGDEIRVRWNWLLTSAMKDPDPWISLPVKADRLMPLKPSRGIYLVKEGPKKGGRVPFTLEQRADRWILTKEGLAWHELQRDNRGNLLILREADLLKNRGIEYNPPVILLPAAVDNTTSLSGKSQVTIKNLKSGSVLSRGECRWRLTFLGVEPRAIDGETAPIYCLRMIHRIRLPLGQTSTTIDFGYALGKGMVATAIEQAETLFGILRNRVVWRLEQILASDESRLTPSR